MNFIPEIYEDELLYSVIARYKQMCGIQSMTSLLKDVYGKKVKHISMILPQHTEILLMNMPPNHRITATEIIHNHTLYPYYTAFLNGEKRDYVYNNMLVGKDKSIEILIGITAWTIKSNRYLKYCPKCIQEQVERDGEGRWNRIWQIPGVLFCDKHDEYLRESQVLALDIRDRYMCADYLQDKVSQSGNNRVNERYRDLNRNYIRLVRLLLNNKWDAKNPIHFKDYYIDILRQKGFASKTGHIYMNDLIESFQTYYTNDYLNLMQSELDINSQSAWLRLFIRDTQKNRHPLRHLLLIQFLSIELEDIFTTTVTIGKSRQYIARIPRYNVENQRQKWLKLVLENQGLKRYELRQLGKGLYTWIYRYDREWYHANTPSYFSIRKVGIGYCEEKDRVLLEKVKATVKEILEEQGKPRKVTKSSIKKMLGSTRGLFNQNMRLTNDYIEHVLETVDEFRKRKIYWAIAELEKEGKLVTPYKVQIKAGFGGEKKSKVRSLINEILRGIK